VSGALEGNTKLVEGERGFESVRALLAVMGKEDVAVAGQVGGHNQKRAKGIQCIFGVFEVLKGEGERGNGASLEPRCQVVAAFFMWM
jgi:hypothetical protein